MKLKEMLKELDHEILSGSVETEVTRMAIDSREARDGDLFVCIDGFTTDGHKYIPQAWDNGARVFVVSRVTEIPMGAVVVKVKDTRIAMAHLAAALFEKPTEQMQIVGVTGTKGKTTTTLMIYHILEAAGKIPGIIGTLGARIGRNELPTGRTTPESLTLQQFFAEMKQAGVETAVMEVSSQGLELHRVDCIHFNTAVFTNLTQDHISANEHPDMEAYFQAKARLFTMCDNGFINADSAWANRLKDAATCQVMTFGIDNPADVRATQVELRKDGVSFRVSSPWGTAVFNVSIPGKFTVYNALSAICATWSAGFTPEQIQAGFNATQVPGRFERVPCENGRSVIVDYAHTPDSLENVLKTAREFTTGKLISVFGCGGDRDRTKRPVMGAISGRIADFTIVTSDNPRSEEPVSILKEIEEGIRPVTGNFQLTEDRHLAIRQALIMSEPGDVILIAGKGHETYQMFRDKTIHFDDREVAAEVMTELEKTEWKR